MGLIRRVRRLRDLEPEFGWWHVACNMARVRWLAAWGRKRGRAMTRCGPGLLAAPSSLVLRGRDSTIEMGANGVLAAHSVLVAQRHKPWNEAGARIILGDKVEIKEGARVTARSGLIRMGDDVAVGMRCTINCGSDELTIGNHVRIAQDAYITTMNHDISRTDTTIAYQGVTHQPVVIEDDVWIATRVIILPGVRVGKGSVLGAGAVVTGDIPPYSVAAGVPARVLRSRLPGEAPAP
jgi:acetyltransferase-like isoleucine patch superfamily enzyme